MLNYLDAIGQYYPDSRCECSGDPANYNDIIWITTAVTQAELDAVILIDYKTEKVLEMSTYTEEEITAGFDSSALGTPHFYDSDATDQLNLIGAVASGADMPYACRPLTKGMQEINVGGAITGTDSTGFANDVTTYNAEIVVNGLSTYVSVVGQDAQTYASLVTAIQADLSLGDNTSTIAITNGNLIITSDAYGGTSTINIIDADLFSTLTQYVALATPIDGLSGPDVSDKVYKQHTNAQFLTVINDGKDVKLTALQKFNVKRAQITEAADKAAVDAIVWE